MQVSAAKGRFIVGHPPASSKYISEVLSERFPGYKFPGGDDNMPTAYGDASKVRRSVKVYLQKIAVLCAGSLGTARDEVLPSSMCVNRIPGQPECWIGQDFTK